MKVTKGEARWLLEYHTGSADNANFMVKRQRKAADVKHWIPTEEYVLSRTYHRARARYWKKYYGGL